MTKRFNQWNVRFRSSQLFLALKAYWPLVLGVSLNMVAQTVLVLVQPWPMRTMIDHVVEHSAHSHGTAAKSGLFFFIFASARDFLYSSDFDFLYEGTGLLLLIYLSSAVLLYFQNTSLTRLGQEVVFRIRKNLFSQTIALPHSYFEKAQTGDLTSRISKDTAEVQDILESFLTIFIRSIPTVLGILVVSFLMDWIYALTFVLVIPLVYWSNVVFTKRTRDAIRKQRRIEGNMASTVQEAFYYHKAVATLSLENDVVEDFLKNSRKSALHGVRAGRFQGFLTASLDFLIGATSVFVLFVGILRIMHGCLTIGQLTVFLTYLNSLFKPIREVSKLTGRIAKSMAAMERIEEIARLNPLEIGATDLPDAVEAPPFTGRIELAAITFGYNREKPIFEELSLVISAGQKIAFVGGSGSGKSTILQLIMRLYDPQKGQIRIDGIDIRTLELASLRSQMAMVLQDSFIFNMTIAENIAIAKPGATEDEVIAAAKAAEAHDFIRELPRGYETTLGEGGAGLSGGQKRRLAIARAFLRDAPIVILDEPTVGLDAASEQKVVEAVGRLTKGKTTLIVTHQLSTIADADHIVVLARGEIVECGTHEKLLRQTGHYRDLWESQQLETPLPLSLSQL